MFHYNLKDFFGLKETAYKYLFLFLIAKVCIIIQAFINCEENPEYFQASQLVVNYSKLRYNYLTINDSFPVSMKSHLTNLF
jgi:hypothetical protein